MFSSIPRWVWLLLLGGLLILPRMGTYGLWDPTEIREADVASERASLIAARLLHDDRFAVGGRDLLRALRRTLVGRGARVPTAAGPQRYVNLDNWARTPTFQPIWLTIGPFFCQ